MDFRISIVRGDDAWSLLQDDAFIDAWDLLARVDRKATLIQEYPFVRTWYEQYADAYVPLLCLGYDGENALVGLIPLAQSTSSGSLTHAGGGQAEYHGWIAAPQFDEDFLVASLVELYRQLPIDRWTWRWLPPGAPLGWIDSDKLRRAGIYVTCMNQRAPLLDLSDAAKVKKITRNKSIKSKVNRYKRRGKFHLERIVSVARAEELLPVLREQCDFRQGAVNDATPFRSDRNKLPFFVQRMHYPEVNHFTVLWLEDKPIAFHFGACDDDRVLLGLTSYDPVESRNSPGTLLLTELITMLSEEGYRYYDLTPGENSYKDRFANRQEPVCMPTFVRSRVGKARLQTKEAVRVTAQSLIRRLGLSHKVVDRARRVARNPGLLRDANALRTMFGKPALRLERHAGLYRLDPDKFRYADGAVPQVACQRFEHLLDFAEPVDRNVFMLEALQRFESGDVFYSISKDGVLAQSIWLKKIDARSNGQRTAVQLPENSLLLYDAYTHARYARHLPYRNLLGQVVRDNLNAGSVPIYATASRDRSAFFSALEEIGFDPTPASNTRAQS